MIVGSEGIGKMAVARQIAAGLLDLPHPGSLERYPHFHIVSPDGQNISIELIRQLLNLTKLKIVSDRTGILRVIIIDEAQSMTTEAQNALLKLLEEPPASTAFLLNTVNAQSLLPTIRSRAQQLTIKQPGREELEAYFATLGFDVKQVTNAFLMSGGLPGLMHALLHDTEHPLIKAVTQTRELLKASTFERLTAVDKLAKQKAECIRLLFVLQQMAHATISQTVSKNGSVTTLKQWQRVLAASYDAQIALSESVQPKLVLTNLMLAL